MVSWWHVRACKRMCVAKCIALLNTKGAVATLEIHVENIAAPRAMCKTLFSDSANPVVLSCAARIRDVAGTNTKMSFPGIGDHQRATEPARAPEALRATEPARASEAIRATELERAPEVIRATELMQGAKATRTSTVCRCRRRCPRRPTDETSGRCGNLPRSTSLWILWKERLLQTSSAAPSSDTSS